MLYFQHVKHCMTSVWLEAVQEAGFPLGNLRQTSLGHVQAHMSFLWSQAAATLQSLNHWRELDDFDYFAVVPFWGFLPPKACSCSC